MNKDITINLKRNDSICYAYFIEGKSQVEIAKEIGISQSMVSHVVRDFKKDDDRRIKLLDRLEKEYSFDARKLAKDLISQVDPATHPKSKLVMDSAILIDKARLIDGEADKTVDINITIQKLEDNEVRIKEIYSQLGRDPDLITLDPEDVTVSTIKSSS